LKRTDTYWPGRDRKYADLSEDQIPLTESLKDCMERTQPIWEDRIQRELKRGRNVMVVGHANTLRGLVKTIDDIDDDDISGKLSLPNNIEV
jgi:2,3-bisphosphoglycerate-dependent phosphoglycerate mutase